MALPEFVFRYEDTVARLVASYLKEDGRIATELEPSATAQWSVCPIFSISAECKPRLVKIDPEVGNPEGIQVPEWAAASYDCYVIIGSIDKGKEHEECRSLVEAIKHSEFYLLTGGEL